MHAPDFERLFNAVPANYLVLDLDWNIVAITDTALGERARTDVVGRNQFEVFPDNLDDPASSGTASMVAALERVLKEKTGHVMPVTRYDIADADGVFQVHYWRPVNQPVFDASGVITHIIHGVEDVTDATLAEME